MTSPSKLPLAQTTELYTGDIVELDEFHKKTNGVQYRVTKTTSPCSCESGVMVTIEELHGKHSCHTLDRHWVVLMVKASEIDFDDDIPF